MEPKVQKRGPRKISVLYPLPNISQGEKGETEKPKQRVAAYCRVSSGSEEQLSSYVAQINYYESYIKENSDYIFVGIYADEGISGTSMKKRDAFLRLMQDCRDGRIDMVITKSVSRFGRNTLDCLKSIRELKSFNVDVFFEKENIHTLRNEGEMLLTLISAVAQNESLNLSENVRWGIHRKYERGNVKSIPSGKFLGYDKDENGNLVINEEQAAVVRRIYQEFLDGYGYYTIAEHLTESKIPTEQGLTVWSCSLIKKILTNEKMKGDTLFQKTFNADHLTKHRVKNNGELPQVYLENTHPPIIEKDMWECVQLEFARQEEFIREHKMSRYHFHSEQLPMSGKIICAECGRPLVRRQSKRLAEMGEYYWCCPKYREGRFTPNGPDTCCNDLRIPDALPEQMFIQAWNRLVDEYDRYLPELQQAANGSDLLKSYRAKELMRLVEQTGHIDSMPYELMLKTLSHIELVSISVIRVIFIPKIEWRSF
ncbi:MAG TPA: recombinase family protein [Caproicibacter sp.]|nr:recombinase family protein [Caproicibacter sp.]